MVAGCAANSARAALAHHGPMEDSLVCRRPLTRQDASALIGLSAILASELMLGQLDPDLERHLRRRLAGEGLLGEGQGEDLVAALEGLAQRLHHALE